MTEIDCAVAQIQAKEQDIRVACVEFDLTMSGLRQTLQLPASRTSWESAMANRLSFLNKQYRTNLKNDLQAISSTMRQNHGDGHVHPALVARLLDRMQRDRASLAQAEALMEECEALYEARLNDGSLDILGRVRFYRGMPPLRQGLEKAHAYDRQTHDNFACWKHYFLVLSSESALSDLFEDLRATKLTKAAAEEKVAPIFASLDELSETRDSIISQAAEVSLRYESKWMALGIQGVRPRELRRALRELDTILDQAKQQLSAQDDFLKQVVDLTALAATPTSLPAPNGVLIRFDELRTANLHFDAIHSTCEAMESLLDVVHKGLQSQKDNLCRLV